MEVRLAHAASASHHRRPAGIRGDRPHSCLAGQSPHRNLSPWNRHRHGHLFRVAAAAQWLFPAGALQHARVWEFDAAATRLRLVARFLYQGSDRRGGRHPDAAVPPDRRIVRRHDCVEHGAATIRAGAQPLCGVEQVAALHQLLPASQVCILPNARHGIAFSHAGPCVEAFLAFAAAQSGSTSTPETL